MVNFAYLVLTTFVIEISSPAMEAQVEIVFGKDTERVKPGRPAGYWISDNVRRAQIGQRGLQDFSGIGIIVCGKASPSGSLGHLGESEASLWVASRLVGINGIEQSSGCDYRVQSVAS